YGISVSCTKVVDRHSCLLFQLLDCAHMANCKVYYMDVVAYSGPVRCVIVITEYAQTLQLADRNLCDIRDQVVRDSLRILSDHSALVSTDRVEVAEQHHIPLRICCVQVCQDLLQHPFCPAVRVRTCSLRALLGDRNKCRVSVNSS